MKIIRGLVILALAWGAWSGAAMADEAVSFEVNGWGVIVDVATMVQQGRVLVPLRAVAEALDAKVIWDPATDTATVMDPITEVKFTVGSTSASRNGQEVKLDVPATRINGRTLVPLRLIAEALGAQVEWRAESRLIAIERDYSYLKSELAGQEYWLNTLSGQLYLVPGAGPALAIGSLEQAITDLGHITAEQTPAGNVLLTITDNYGEPHVHQKVYSVYLRDRQIERATMAYYVYRFGENVRFHRESVILTDGKKAYLFDDHTGQLATTYDLVTLGGEEDSYFIEGIGDNFLLLRPNGKGLLTLVYPETGEKVLLYKELLSPVEQEYAETNDVPFRGDRLRFIEYQDGKLYFHNDSQLQKDNQVYQYSLTGRER